MAPPIAWIPKTIESDIEQKKCLFIKSSVSDHSRRYLSVLSGIAYNERPCYESLRNSII